MFGDNYRLRERLRAKGRQAQAEVLEVKRRRWEAGHGGSVGDPGFGGSSGDTAPVYTMKLRVMPADGPAFEVELTDTPFGIPEVGDMVRVLFDPEHHSKVALDLDASDPSDWSSAANEQRIEDRIAAKEKRSVELGMDPGDAASLAELNRAAISDPATFRKQMFELRDRMMEGSTGPAVVGAEGLAGLAAAFGGGSGQPSSSDPLDQLEKLADLHDRGVLTDAEFAAQKAKLLGDN